MIAYLKGIILKKTLNYIILDVNSVGYKVYTPLSTLCNIEIGNEEYFYIETIFKEDSISLFGFQTEKELETFNKLKTVSKIGPKLALSILSGLSIDKIISAIQQKNIKLLSSIPGIGKKTAERICFDLKDSFDLPSSESSEDDIITTDTEKDLIEALTNLGYKTNEIKDTVAKVMQENQGESLENLLKIILNKLYNG